MILWVDIEDLSGNKLGSGPILAQGWESVCHLDQAGTFRFSMLAADSKAALLVTKRVARGWTLIGATKTEIGAGIIDVITVSVNNAGQATLDVAGDDLMRELTYRSVDDLEIGTAGEPPTPATTGPADIIALAPAGWSLETDHDLDGHSGSLKSIYYKFSGESVLQALVKLAELTGEHFRLGTGRKIIWMQDHQSASGIRAIQSGDAIALEGNTDVCLIQDLQEKADSYELVTRVYPYGAGEGSARITLAGSVWSPPAGYSIETADNYIVNTSAEAATGTPGIRIDAVPQSWKEIKDTDSLAERAYEWLSRHSQAYKSYEITITKLDQALAVGSTIRVVYSQVVDSYTAIDIDADLVVLQTTRTIDSGGIRTTALQVATVDRWPESDSGMMVNAIVQSTAYQSHAQPIAAADLVDVTPVVITGFDESAQDAVGTILTDTNSIDLTYTDGTPAITADVKLATGSGLEIAATGLRAKLLGDVMGMFLMLPGLRGFWPMSSVDESGQPLDLSGQGRTLTNNGTCTFPVLADLLPYVELNGSSQYLSRADEAGLDITGALTMGGWFQDDTLGVAYGLLSKWSATGAQRSYQMVSSTSDKVVAYVSSDGTASVNQASSASVQAATWHFCVLRYTPSTELAVFLDGVKATNVTSIPAAAYVSTAELEIGALSEGSNLLDGRCAFPFICAAALSDNLLTNLYNRSRILFGV